MKPQSTYLFGALTLGLLMVGCATDRAYRPEQLIRVEHPTYVAELIRPETARFSKRNARFVEGGWLVSLIPKATGEDVFHNRSVIPGFPALGLPVEFMDVVPLGDDRYLRIGVGIVSIESAKDNFHDRIQERFPWYSEVVSDAIGTTVRYYQLAPRYYFYTRTIRFENSSKQIVFEDELVNVGAMPLQSRALFHPFFKLPLTAEPWCRLDSEPDFANLDRPALPGKGRAFFTTSEVPADKAWFVCGAENPLAALWVQGAHEVGYWREKHVATHVFAVEPFVNINVPPWNTRKWTWGISIP